MSEGPTAGTTSGEGADSVDGMATVAHGAEDELTKPICKPFREKPLCGTFGCTLPNNHRGLHRIPSEEGPTGRGRRARSDARREPAAGPPERSKPASQPSDEDASASASSWPARDVASGAAEEAGEEAEGNPYRCPRHPLCVRGRKHPGLCKLLATSGRMVDRILSKNWETHRAKGRPVSRLMYLVQYIGEARSQAVWEPATAMRSL